MRARVGGPAVCVEDACAFAWEQLLRTQPQRTDRLFGWLVTVAVREGWRLVRIERRETPASQQLDCVADRRFDPEQHMRALEALQALTQLRPAERRLLCLLVAGCSYREIAALEQRRRNYVNKHLVRARRRLREREGGEN